MFNDSACDPRGRLFAGSKTVRGEPFLESTLPGRVYCCASMEGGQIQTREMTECPNMTVPNGMAFSPDGKTM